MSKCGFNKVALQLGFCGFITFQIPFLEKPYLNELLEYFKALLITPLLVF